MMKTFKLLIPVLFLAFSCSNNSSQIESKEELKQTKIDSINRLIDNHMVRVAKWSRQIDSLSNGIEVAHKKMQNASLAEKKMLTNFISSVLDEQIKIGRISDDLVEEIKTWKRQIDDIEVQ